MSTHGLNRRIKTGWSIADALTVPSGYKNAKQRTALGFAPERDDAPGDRPDGGHACSDHVAVREDDGETD
jgi:hypothetical protein